VLAQILRDLVSRSSLITLMYQRDSRRRAFAGEHVELVKALAAKDEKRAVRLMDGTPAHVEGSLAFDRPCPPTTSPWPSHERTLYDSTAPYPRDLAGYGRNPPHAQWPGNARVAVQFVLNYEEGGENCVLHGDAGSEQFLSEMFNPPAFPDAPEHGGIYEYGSRAGVWRILREFEKRGLPLTVFGVGMALERAPGADAGLRRTRPRDRLPRLDVDPLPERRRSDRARAHAPGHGGDPKLTGERPLGWYTGRDSPNTRRLVADYGGFETTATTTATTCPSG
jgi:hypothetical protein